MVWVCGCGMECGGLGVEVVSLVLVVDASEVVV